ncbi:MAG TPA: hypothetical protein VJJ55_01050 [Candidatus Paceibacterota bacterium]
MTSGRKSRRPVRHRRSFTRPRVSGIGHAERQWRQTPSCEGRSAGRSVRASSRNHPLSLQFFGSGVRKNEFPKTSLGREVFYLSVVIVE